MTNNMFLRAILISILMPMCWCRYTCPKINDTMEVNLTELAGEWYTVAATPITGGIGSCLHFDVASNDQNFSMNYTTTSYRNNMRLLWKVAGEQSGTELSATWLLTFRNTMIGPFRHQILEIDYQNYCTMIVCANDTKYIPKQMFGMIWARKKTLSLDLLSELKKSISRFVDEEDIRDVDNTCEGIQF
ncbi:hypothetical protein PV327_003525 [Microctonus hyperodae]|uniref:Lipocalin/cytosolic fatty-acid binding domain-containing protein n=1 Tax=Microctonus hyperodae TaxID=165561 RepID=A0AA39L0Z3_MICHY|nr:hypothetical protein PV327_003525 [Microctonus hyperodae]